MIELLFSYSSPYGDYGSYHYERLVMDFGLVPLVSVPLRGLWFLSKNYERINEVLESAVSVPLRGLWFLSTTGETMRAKLIVRVSVPLRGLWFLSLSLITGNKSSNQSFPSPCGDYGSYQTGKKPQRSQLVESFRPLAGIMVLIDYITSCMDWLEDLVSVPLRGLWFLSGRYRFNEITLSKQGFPSPCGDYGSYQREST